MTKEEVDSLVGEILTNYPELSEAGFMVEFIDGYNFIGACNTLDPNDLVIQLNMDYAEINDEKLIRHCLLHEVAHALDFIRHDGWRINEKTGRVKYHDKEFKQICKELGIPGTATPNYPINIPKKKLKQYRKPKGIEISLDIFEF